MRDARPSAAHPIRFSSHLAEPCHGAKCGVCVFSPNENPDFSQVQHIKAILVFFLVFLNYFFLLWLALSYKSFTFTEGVMKFFCV